MYIFKSNNEQIKNFNQKKTRCLKSKAMTWTKQDQDLNIILEREEKPHAHKTLKKMRTS